jgi:hypothetical protein
LPARARPRPPTRHARTRRIHGRPQDHRRERLPNGEGGTCAPLSGRIELRTRADDRINLVVSGDSCQDGSGPLSDASFTGLARFRVTHGTGKYAGATGRGLATFTEDAGNRHLMTLVGRIAS